MSSFSVQALQEKLSRLTPSQDSIETLSLWIIHHQAYAPTSVTIWLESLRSADADHRLTLFYLANDILQNGRRRGAAVFVDAFKGPLKDAVSFVSGQKIQSSVERMLRIWRDRKVYDSAYIKELLQSIDTKKTEKSQGPSVGDDFKLTLVEDAVMEFRKFEGEMKIKSAFFSNMRIDVSNTSSLALLKDKSAGGRFLEEFEETSLRLQDFCTCLGVEVSERANVATMLKECKAYHATKLTELQALAQRCRSMLSETCSLKEKLEVRKKELDRAQHTSTSDPAARDDINDIGDMEIDAESEELAGAATEKSKSAALPHPGRPVQSVQPVVAPSTQVPLSLPPIHTPSAPPQSLSGPITHLQQPPIGTSAAAGHLPPLNPPRGPFHPPVFRSGPPTMGGFPPHGLPPPNVYPPPHPASSMPRMGGPLLSSNPPSRLGYLGPPPPMMHDMGIPPHNSGMLPHTHGMGGVPPTLGPPALGMGGGVPPALGMGGGILPAPSMGGVGAHPPAAMTGIPPLFPLNSSGPYSSAPIVPGPLQKGPAPNQTLAMPAQAPSPNIPTNQLAVSSQTAPQAPPLASVVTSAAVGVLLPARVGPTFAAATTGVTNVSSALTNPTTGSTNASGLTNSAAGSASNSAAGLATGISSNVPTSLDDRLKNLMTQKSFSRSLLHDYSDSSSDEGAGDNGNDDQTPYSPSMAELVINFPETKDALNESLNSPRSPTPEDLPLRPNFATNPILKVLFPSDSSPLRQQNPEGKRGVGVVPSPDSPKVVQPSSSLLAGVDTHLLQSILNTVKTGAPTPTNAPALSLAELVLPGNRPFSSSVTKTAPRNDGPRASVPQSVALISAIQDAQPQKSVASSSFPSSSAASVTPSSSSTSSTPTPIAVKPIKRDDIKFTPSLTSFLDKIFPELSKSLSEERKRKIDTSSPSEATAAEIPLVAKVPRTEAPSACTTSSATEVASLSHAQNQDNPKRKERSPPSAAKSDAVGVTLPQPPSNGSLKPEPSFCPAPTSHQARPEDGQRLFVNFHRLGAEGVRPNRPPPSLSSSGNIWADDNFCWQPDDTSSSPRQPSPLPPPQQTAPPQRLPAPHRPPPSNRMPPPHRDPPFRDHPPPDFIRDRSPPDDRFPPPPPGNHFHHRGDVSPRHGPGRMDDAVYPTRYKQDRYHGGPPSPPYRGPPYHGLPPPPFRGPPPPPFHDGPNPYPRGPRGPNMFGPPPPFRPRFM
eukprot:Em0009g988a